MKTEEIAQWVINNRYSKSENDKVSDSEMYYFIVDEINNKTKELQEQLASCQASLLDVTRILTEQLAAKEKELSEVKEILTYSGLTDYEKVISIESITNTPK